ncbi:MAG TPA: GNAT family N-acetyltransferase [Miltoncostaeaceae bacterium]|nr:GNAT family N-acetyltransferase [Miltoncostaeaceae bacterium]
MAGAWDALASACRRPLAAPGWVRAWWGALRPPGAELRVAAAWDGGDLIGLLPAMRLRTGRMDELVGLAPAMAVRGVALAAPGVEAPAAALLARAITSDAAVHRLRLEQVATDDPLPGLLQQAWPGLLRPELRRGAPSPVPVMGMDGMDYEGWLAAKSSNFRQRVRRERRRMEARGAELRMATAPAEVERALEAFAALHGARWGDRSPLSGPGGHEMMRRAAAALGPDRFRAHVIEAEGRAVSVQLFVAAGGELIYWNGGWDPDWAQHSPALVGIVAALEDGFARGERRLDLGEDDSYDYKQRLADGDAPVQRITLTPRGRRYPAALAADAPRLGRALARRAVARVPADLRRRLPGAAGGS